jgi:tetratricopeptide (TPR) repeat protein
MSNKKQQQEPDELQNVEQALSKTEQFIENNRKQLVWGLVIVAVIAIAVVWFFNGYVAPKNVEAADKMAAAVRYFERDSFALALNGDGMNEGFIEIIDNYGITESSALAAFYAGVCEYKLGNYDEAISYLKKFNAASVNMEPAALTLIGDSYVANGDVKSAVKYFEQAGAIENDLTAPRALNKAGIAYEELGEWAKAEKCYQTIKDVYFDSQLAMEMDKRIERCQANK